MSDRADRITGCV